MEFIVKTDIGVVRSENQDRANVFQKNGDILAVLCDGMGGHEGGLHASRITIDTFEREFNKKLPSNHNDYDKWFTNTLKKSKKNMEKFVGSDSSLMDMGTTITAALINKKKIHIFNVGDSRTYVYNGLLHQITIDHNLRNYYINKFGYSEENAATVIGAAALTSALGPKKKAFAEQFLIENDEKTKYVILTSDGIHDYIAKPNFEKIIAADASLNKKAMTLIRQAIKGKSSDNLTIIILELN
ncbi:PP2C family protein-serine/threonine phosphatase [Candidatus Mycoplasma mahonii]|uniref:PP2C family protein-serine/threonine phosphatase n=1 Tax=Candidatus Mycoplasma mahonii TaxID=3004105 RepID=UPI0026F1555B|nr:PP2C family serine/threonine-protein phosphatase [Candidatus Mycoplasma mahonii]WKX02718.1 serine/threonine-protein phosphatase [Candidatus Mycoplasma mahonii]